MYNLYFWNTRQFRHPNVPIFKSAINYPKKTFVMPRHWQWFEFGMWPWNEFGFSSDAELRGKQIRFFFIIDRLDVQNRYMQIELNTKLYIYTAPMDRLFMFKSLKISNKLKNLKFIIAKIFVHIFMYIFKLHTDYNFGLCMKRKLCIKKYVSVNIFKYNLRMNEKGFKYVLI